ncbi:MAG TPA: condensation domain-containing protein, partial [Blastocatellia bacterium]|nr:condensation domain-containing protein [Blastocatellia bacterium]
GEALPPDVCRQWIARYPNKPIVNAWGPTETSDDVTHFHVNEIDDDAVSVPIGRTLGNMAAFVLDGDLSPVPLETPGEIYAGGICVGRGYLGDPEKTAANFRPDPFSRLPGARAYKTGDLGRLTADCHIDFLGRIDHQVKVRGYRIELGEVEAAIAQHPDVHEVSILAREGQPGEKRLVAYIVLKQGTDLSVSALRDSLREKLPDYMVPSAVIVLQSLPRTANGKLDRKSLPAPDSSRPELEEDFVPASTPVEKVLAEIWSQVLGVKSVGVHDNFFELGGDSIQCIQIVARARQAGLQIAPNQIFQFQTIGELAAEVVSAARATTAAQGLVTGLVPLTPIQRWFFELDFANPNFHNQVLALEARDPLNHSVMRKAIAVLLSHHDALRLRFSRSGDQWSQTGGHPEDATPFSVMDLSDVIQSEQERRVRQIAEELSASIRLDGPVFNSMLFDLGAGRPNILVLVAHHLVVDGVSWRIVHEDLQTAYEQLANGDPAALPPKTNSYKEWAERLFDYAQSPAIELEAGFWTESLNSEHLDRLPLDHPEGDNCVASTRFVSAELDSEETQALLRDVTRDCQARVNELLLAALLSATFTWTGQSHVMIDLEGHGRSAIFEDLDLTRTVGWFTSIYPVLFECGRDLRPEDLVKSVMKQARQVPKDGVGFGLLRYLNGNPGVATAFRRMPCPEISFNYLGQLGAALPTDQILSWQSISLASDPNRPRTCVLEINAVVSAGRLRLSIGYSENLHDEATIRRVAGNYMAFLKGLIDYTRFADDGITSASRFPEANLSDEQLAQVVALLG